MIGVTGLNEPNECITLFIVNNMKKKGERMGVAELAKETNPFYRTKFDKRHKRLFNKKQQKLRKKAKAARKQRRRCK